MLTDSKRNGTGTRDAIARLVARTSATDMAKRQRLDAIDRLKWLLQGFGVRSAVEIDSAREKW